MAQPPVLAHPADAGGERLGQQQVAEHLGGVGVELVDRRPVVAPVEVAEEVAAVAPVERQQRRGLGQRLGDVAEAVVPGQASGGEPRVRRHDVRGDEGVLEVEGGEVPLGGEHLATQAIGAVLDGAPARRGAHPGVVDDRRQVHVVHVGGPVDDPGVEAERVAIGLVEALVPGEQPVDPVDRLAFGVGTVELDVPEGPFGLVALLLELGGPGGLLAPERQRLEHRLGPVHRRLGPLELALDAAPPGERPVGHDDRLALAVVEGTLGEPGAHQVDELAVAQRVGRSRRHLGDLGLVGGPAGRGVDDGGDHHVDGDDVDGALGDAGELLQQAAGVADDDRLGHAEAADPARAGLGPRRLDDRGAHDRHGDVAPLLEQGPLAERLGVGVGVGPAERGGAGPPGLDHAVLDPGLATLLGLGGQGGGAGRAQLADRLGPEPR